MTIEQIQAKNDQAYFLRLKQGVYGWQALGNHQRRVRMLKEQGIDIEVEGN